MNKIEDNYKETFELLIAVLAIIAFIVTTTDYLIWKEKSSLPDTSPEGVENSKWMFTQYYLEYAYGFIIIFLLYFINKNLIKSTQFWLIPFIKVTSILVTFILVGVYIQVLTKWVWLGRLLYYSTIDKYTILGNIKILLHPSTWAYILLIWVIFGLIVITLLNVFLQVKLFLKVISKRFR